jgi:methionine--tRNA ligase beta chain
MTATFEDFSKLQIRIGLVIEAERIEGTDKLLKLQVDFGNEKRQIVSGIAEFYKPGQLINKEFPFVVNLEPRTIRGVESQGMILAIGTKDKIVLLKPQKKVPPGVGVR